MTVLSFEVLREPIRAVYRQRQGIPLDQSPAHGGALSKHWVWYLAEGFLSSARKVSLDLSYQQTFQCLSMTGAWTKNPPLLSPAPYSLSYPPKWELRFRWDWYVWLLSQRNGGFDKLIQLGYLLLMMCMLTHKNQLVEIEWISPHVRCLCMYFQGHS